MGTSPPSAERVILVGMMGAGKTSIGQRLADRLGWRYLDSDEQVERNTGRTVPEIFETDGEAAFRREEARALAEEVGYDYGRSIAARMEPTEGHRSVKAAVASVADALTAHGFAAHAEARGNLLTLVSEHCPFGEAAQKWPHVLCAVDTGMVRGMLEGLYGETQPQLTESRPGGDQHCVTRV